MIQRASHAGVPLLALLLSCAGGGDPREPEEALGAAAQSIQGAFSAYENKCVCGTSYPGTNCAHYLSNAFMKAGYTMPAGEKCPKGRLIRAKEMLDWFQSRKTEYTKGHPGKEGYYAVYQESGGQGHVCLHREFKKGSGWDFQYKGTGDYSDWPVNWHYRW